MKNETVENSETYSDEDPTDVPMVEIWRRDYSLNDFPRNDFGEILPLEDKDEDFLIYVEWLADYLYESLPASGEFLQMIEKNLSHYQTPAHAILVLAFDANLYDYEISVYDDFIEYPNDFDETELVPEIIKQAGFENERKYESGFEKAPCANFSDISWRVPLAWILKKVPDKKERIELLKSYFEEYGGMSYK